MKTEHIACILGTAFFIFVVQYFYFKIKAGHVYLFKNIKKHLKKNIDHYKESIPVLSTAGGIFHEYEAKFKKAPNIVFLGFHTPVHYDLWSINSLIISYLISDSAYIVELQEHHENPQVKKIKTRYKGGTAFEIIICQTQNTIPEHSTFCLGIVIV
jgi:hypothetical protein